MKLRSVAENPLIELAESSEDEGVNPQELQADLSKENLREETLPELVEGLRAWKEKVDAWNTCKQTTEIFKRSAHDSFLPELIEGFGIEEVEKVLRSIRAEDRSGIFSSDINPAYTAVLKIIPNEEQRLAFLDEVILQTKFEIETLKDTARERFEASNVPATNSVTHFLEYDETELLQELREKANSTEMCRLLFEPKLARIAGRLAGAIIEPGPGADWGWNMSNAHSGLESFASIVRDGRHLHMGDTKFNWAMQGIRSAENHDVGAFVHDAQETLEIGLEQLIAEIGPMLAEFRARRQGEVGVIENAYLTANERILALMKDQVNSPVIAASPEVLAQLLEKNIAELQQLGHLRAMRLEEVSRKYEMKHLEQVVSRLKEQREVL